MFTLSFRQLSQIVLLGRQLIPVVCTCIFIPTKAFILFYPSYPCIHIHIHYKLQTTACVYKEQVSYVFSNSFYWCRSSLKLYQADAFTLHFKYINKRDSLRFQWKLPKTSICVSNKISLQACSKGFIPSRMSHSSQHNIS